MDTGNCLVDSGDKSVVLFLDGVALHDKVPHKRKSYSAEYKLQAVKYAAENGNRAAGRKFGVSEKLVRDWRKMEVTLTLMKKTKKANRGLKARWPELEKRVYRWVLEQRAAGRRLSAVQLRLHALIVAKEMNIQDFAGGPSWCSRFMQRNRLSMGTQTKWCQKRPLAAVDDTREMQMSFIKEESEDIRIADVFNNKHEDTEEQTEIQLEYSHPFTSEDEHQSFIDICVEEMGDPEPCRIKHTEDTEELTDDDDDDDDDDSRRSWKEQRDALVKHNQKLPPSVSNSGTVQEWKYEVEMSFLLPHLSPRSSRCELGPGEPLEDTQDSTDLSSVEERTATPPAQTPSTPLSPARPVERTATPPASEGCSAQTPSTPLSPAHTPTQTRPAPDSSRPAVSEDEQLLDTVPVPAAHQEMYSFALSLVPRLTRLSREAQAQAQAQFLTLLSELEDRQLAQMNTPGL
ncbi:uncharacterized protein LOC113067371 isoform X4 [Carassius auratus]|uniref:Uncharacterized protein LOC113067371 isoform X4 n=1 Tax=Carassius auratus TaxID=7957 RepID=A0A6P6MFR6_CARAU|nr:uncharacterized protein LOC113067371 isoform X4 [Carassius auratus]